MNQDLEADRYKIDKVALSAFLLPFIVGGICFAILANNYLNTLPPIIVTGYDRAYAVFLAFADMGLAFGVGTVTALCFFRQVTGAFKRFRIPKGVHEIDQ